MDDDRTGLQGAVVADDRLRDVGQHERNAIAWPDAEGTERG